MAPPIAAVVFLQRQIRSSLPWSLKGSLCTALTVLLLAAPPVQAQCPFGEWANSSPWAWAIRNYLVSQEQASRVVAVVTEPVRYGRSANTGAQAMLDAVKRECEQAGERDIVAGLSQFLDEHGVSVVVLDSEDLELVNEDINRNRQDNFDRETVDKLKLNLANANYVVRLRPEVAYTVEDYTLRREFNVKSVITDTTTRLVQHIQSVPSNDSNNFVREWDLSISKPDTGDLARLENGKLHLKFLLSNDSFETACVPRSAFQLLRSQGMTKTSSAMRYINGDLASLPINDQCVEPEQSIVLTVAVEPKGARHVCTVMTTGDYGKVTGGPQEYQIDEDDEVKRALCVTLRSPPPPPQPSLGRPSGWWMQSCGCPGPPRPGDQRASEPACASGWVVLQTCSGFCAPGHPRYGYVCE